MKGNIVVSGIVLTAAIAGAFVYYTQVYAYYTPVTFTPGAEILLTPIVSATPEAIIADNLMGIDADSSPLRFRACFHSDADLSTLTEAFQTYDRADPLIAPSWFTCFDAARIGAALETGEAVAFLGQAGIAPQVDRVIAVFPDGSAYAWHQLQPETGE